ncbi:sperm acrosome membrane-associated protein 4-like [Chelonoidis abingdonii]|nr:sperm acrosome membrane-associated protein 4-like [Chelonoidis abingdonii]
MGKILVPCLAVLTCVGIGVALQCLKCEFTIHGNLCCISTVSCDTGQLCVTVRGHAADHKLVMKKDCVEREKCQTNSTSTFAGVTYSTYYECCEGEFCNSAAGAGAQLSLAAGLAMLGAWLARGL